MANKRTYQLVDYTSIVGLYLEADKNGLPEGVKVPLTYFVTNVALGNYLNKTTDLIDQSTAEGGTDTVVKSWNSLRVRQAIVAWYSTINQKVLTIEQISGQSANFTKIFTANSKLEEIDYRWRSGTPNVKIGITDGGEEILPAMDVPVDSQLLNGRLYPFDNDTETFITITGGGEVDIIFIYRLTYWTT